MRPDVLPVIVSGEQSAYALARLMHEATGSRVLCVSPQPIEAITRSSFIDVHRVPLRQDDDALCATLEEIRDAHVGRTLVVMANHDNFARFAAVHRERLGERVIMPYPSLDVFDAVQDKGRFSEICRAQGIPTPPDTVVDLADPQEGEWTAPQVDLRFPVVAKAIDALDYARVSFEGKAKVFFVDSQDELDALWAPMRAAGFTGRFLVQERIPGDDTCGVSLTSYVDSRGRVTLRSSARVLVEDHDPTAIGNPIAMLVEDYPQMHEQIESFFRAVGYTGFANVDVKVDPRDGAHYFFEINPRMGRNCYYVRAGGINLMEPMLADLVDGRSLEPRRAAAPAVYSLIPRRLIYRYLREPGLASRVRAVIRRSGVHDPMLNPEEKNVRRAVVVHLQRLNYYRKLNRFYPRPEGLYC
ncbi:carboxylate--amine ligase [Actinomyces respiraculi]|uniref:carboxylate--amine ligase n=1 Tax=Actinomyces respiraculi TaxID=2744574 RepID=UPI0014206F7A|nr:carboxylate--amine ligase [Actinomyces respiraculi]